VCAATSRAVRASRLEAAFFVLDRRGRTPRLHPCPLLAPLAQAAREPLPSSLARRLARSSRTAPRQPGSAGRRASPTLAAISGAARASRLEAAYFVLDRRGRTPRLHPCPSLAPLAQAGAREPLPSSLARRLARSSRTAPRQPGSARRRAISDARGNLWSRSRIALGSRLLRPRSPRKNTSSPSSSARCRAISDARSSKPASPLQELRPPSSESDPSGSQASSRPARQRQ
jgi:hypothetical protein